LKRELEREWRRMMNRENREGDVRGGGGREEKTKEV